MPDLLARASRSKSQFTIERVIESVRSLKRSGATPTFNAILADLRSRRVLSNHRSLRAYLDVLVHSGVLEARGGRAYANVRPSQVYSLTGRAPSLEAGGAALLFHGLNWEANRPPLKVRTDLEGLARSRDDGRTSFASLEDTIVANLGKARDEPRSRGASLTFSAALAGTKPLDLRYLMRRARERGVEDLAVELASEIGYLEHSPRPEVEDLKTLYAIRKHVQSVRGRGPFASKSPRWSLFKPDQLVDVLGKQLGAK